MKIIKLSFLLLMSISFGQKIKIIDSIDNKSIPYAKIYVDDKLLIADSSGQYFFDKQPSNFIIRSNNYLDKKILNLESDIIKLLPHYKKIDTVKLSKDHFPTQNHVGFKKSKNVIAIDNNREFAVKIINPFGLCKLENIEIPFKKFLHNKGYLIVNVYGDENNMIGDKLNENEYVIPLVDIKRNNSVEIKERVIVEQAFYISVMWVENIYSKSDVFTNKVYLYVKNNMDLGEMLVRRTVYNSWNIKPFKESSSSENSIIPAFSASIKCKEK